MPHPPAGSRYGSAVSVIDPSTEQFITLQTESLLFPGMACTFPIFLLSVIFQGLGHSHICYTNNKNKWAKKKTFFSFIVPSCHVEADRNTKLPQSVCHV